MHGLQDFKTENYPGNRQGKKKNQRFMHERGSHLLGKTFSEACTLYAKMGLKIPVCEIAPDSTCMA